MAAFINQYYEYGTSKGQNNDSDIYNLCYAKILKKGYIYSIKCKTFISPINM